MISAPRHAASGNPHPPCPCTAVCWRSGRAIGAAGARDRRHGARNPLRGKGGCEVLRDSGAGSQEPPGPRHTVGFASDSSRSPSSRDSSVSFVRCSEIACRRLQRRDWQIVASFAAGCCAVQAVSGVDTAPDHPAACVNLLSQLNVSWYKSTENREVRNQKRRRRFLQRGGQRRTAPLQPRRCRSWRRRRRWTSS